MVYKMNLDYDRIFLSPPHMGGNEEKYVAEAFATNWIAPFGKNLDIFESQLCARMGVAHAVPLSSGTAALHLALMALGVSKGDVVMCQSLTFAASAFCIDYVGARPVFIDSEMDTWNMDPELLRQAMLDQVAEGKTIGAIIVVHLYGMPAKMNEIMAIAREFGVPVIEDAAEAMGSTYHGKACGTIGDIGVLSFNGNKIITTSGGGALLSNNATYAERARYYANQTREPKLHYEHKEVGYNYRMSNVVAGIGRGQMEVLDERIELRRSNFIYYMQSLSRLNGVTFCHETSGSISNRWLTTILIDEEASDGIRSSDIIELLNEKNIETRPVWMPMHMQPVFAKEKAYVNGISQKLFETGICLPSGSVLKLNELRRITRIIESVFVEKLIQETVTCD
jgi:dTDP-4-amino-4,6-dideoxygalactose transaminase